MISNRPCLGIPLVFALIALTACARMLAAQPQSPVPRPFGHGKAAPHATEIAPYSFENTVLRLSFDLQQRIVYGDETATVRAKGDGVSELPFNSVAIAYTSITVDGKAVTYDLDEARQSLRVHLEEPASKGARLIVEFRYHVRPERGLYFVGPDRAYPKVVPEIWTQGEPEDNRRWFPTWDEPNEKTPSELIVTVPRGWTVVGNGYLKSHVTDGSNATWDWRAPLPMSTYLIAFAAGPLSENYTTLGSKNVDSYVQPPSAKFNALCFGDTKDIVAFFQRRIGVTFPWEKYDQTTAVRFTEGGMENTSATIQTELALHPASEEPENSCDVLIAHELAQQWWGDDATMSDWANAWLHEGFATYFDELWSGERYGEAEFEYQRYQAQQAYFAETEQYFRPIVDNAYGDPLEVFDASSHQRPGEVLHSLRWMFGDDRFFKAIRSYLLQYQFKNANTHQFFVAIGKSLGTDLSWFEDEWFYRASYPHYVVNQRYDVAAKTLTLHVRQENHDGRPFRMPIAIEAWVGGKTYRVLQVVDRLDQTIEMRGVPAKPQMVLFDPNGNVLRALTFDQAVGDLRFQLLHAPHVGDREWALSQLGKFAAAKDASKASAMRAVREAALRDPFYGVRADATGVAATFGDADAVETALHDPDKRVVLAAEAAAGNLGKSDAAVVASLTELANHPDPNVVAAALQALGALRAPHAYERLVRALNVRSFYEAVACGALQGLAAYGDAKALPLIRERTAYGTEDVERDTAIASLAQLSASLHRPEAALTTLMAILAHDPLISSRIAAANALGALGDPSAIPALENAERDDSQIGVQLTAWDAVVTIRNARR